MMSNSKLVRSARGRPDEAVQAGPADRSIGRTMRSGTARRRRDAFLPRQGLDGLLLELAVRLETEFQCNLDEGQLLQVPRGI